MHKGKCIWLNVNFISIQLPPFSFIMSFVRCTERTCAIKHNILFFYDALQGTNHIIHIHVQKRINTFHFYIYYYLYICYICISIEKKICAFYFGFGPKGCLKSINFISIEFISICSSKVNSKYFRRIDIFRLYLINQNQYRNSHA